MRSDAMTCGVNVYQHTCHYGKFSFENIVLVLVGILIRMDCTKLPFVMKDSLVVKNWKLYKQVNNNFNDIYQIFPPMLRNTYVGEKPFFPYYDALLSKHFANFQPPYTFADFSTQQMCNKKQQRDKDGELSSSTFHYYSGDLMQDEFVNVRKNIDVGALFRNISQLEGLTANVWFGEPGVKATIHYDGVENVFVQLYGEKTLTLWPPHLVEEMHLYGRNHPYACQSRWRDDNALENDWFTIRDHDNIHNNCLKKNESIDNVFQSDEVIHVTLTAGDVLYIPPYWFHDVSQNIFCF